MEVAQATDIREVRDAKNRNRRASDAGKPAFSFRFGDPASRALVLFDSACGRNKDDARLPSLRGAKRRSNPGATAAIVEAFASGLLRCARNDGA
jgi:hypothetical protein